MRLVSPRIGTTALHDLFAAFIAEDRQERLYLNLFYQEKL